VDGIGTKHASRALYAPSIRKCPRLQAFVSRRRMPCERFAEANYSEADVAPRSMRLRVALRVVNCAESIAWEAKRAFVYF